MTRSSFWKVHGNAVRAITVFVQHLIVTRETKSRSSSEVNPRFCDGFIGHVHVERNIIEKLRNDTCAIRCALPEARANYGIFRNIA